MPADQRSGCASPPELTMGGDSYLLTWELELLGEIVAWRIAWARAALTDPTLRGREREDLRVARAIVTALMHVLGQAPLSNAAAYELTCVLRWEAEWPYERDRWRSNFKDLRAERRWRVLQKLRELTWNHRIHSYPR